MPCATRGVLARVRRRAQWRRLAGGPAVPRSPAIPLGPPARMGPGCARQAESARSCGATVMGRTGRPGRHQQPGPRPGLQPRCACSGAGWRSEAQLSSPSLHAFPQPCWRWARAAMSSGAVPPLSSTRRAEHRLKKDEAALSRRHSRPPGASLTVTEPGARAMPWAAPAWHGAAPPARQMPLRLPSLHLFLRSCRWRGPVAA